MLRIMSSVQEVELAIRSLPPDERYVLVQRLGDLLWEAWDRQIESDADAGRLDHILSEVEADVAAGRTKPLDEILGNP